MKVRLEIDDTLNEDEIVIRTKEYTEELKQLISNFKSNRVYNSLNKIQNII